MRDVRGNRVCHGAQNWLLAHRCASVPGLSEGRRTVSGTWEPCTTQLPNGLQCGLNRDHAGPCSQPLAGIREQLLGEIAAHPATRQAEAEALLRRCLEWVDADHPRPRRLVADIQAFLGEGASQ